MYLILNSNKMFFLFMLFFSTLISISSNSWIGCWIGLEINLLSFIPLISNSNNLFSSEASLKYFLIQSIASINFLFFILLKMTLLKNFEMNNLFSILMNSPLLMKMGSAPLHFWFPNIIEGMSWFNSFILMTWQKISPMILLSYLFNKNFLILIIILNAIVGAGGGLNQTSLRKLMTYSSIYNLSWMLSSIMISENLWLFYFLFYSFLISIMCFLFHMLNLYYLNQLFFININYKIKLNFLINFLSLGGLPPFIGFLPKWIVINFLINNNFLLLIFILILSSLITLFFYIRITYASFMFNYLKLKWIKIFMKNKLFLILNFLSFFSILGLILSTFFFM
uniref:NADH-ubiquinone oxidoreductase chain 2 n=1 Tax=Pseudargyria interruptella TaxID=1633014 RepID=A0A139ZRF9_9NEOP|nr:NADH dehydrogenase subunit 2 [Pseudargyria interruptella]AJZ71890.1 NADH dehydrogenase subunit 2 [Pseudargyria interruptella]